MIEYKPSGEVRLTHPGENFPVPKPGQLEALEAEASSLGYELKLLRTRGVLYRYIYPYYETFEGVWKAISLGDPYGAPQRHYEFEDLVFDEKIKLDRKEIGKLFRALPAFFEALRFEEKIDADPFELRFEAERASVAPILICWDGGELRWKEESGEG